MKVEPSEMLFAAMRQVLGGGIFVSAHLEKQLMRRFFVAGAKDDVLDPLESLSDRELEVFRLLGKGKGTREIATHLNLSSKTIESHRARIKEKLNLQNATELVRHAREMQEN
jgi:DNA-binding NarL/FixJ family response regulator